MVRHNESIFRPPFQAPEHTHKLIKSPSLFKHLILKAAGQAAAGDGQLTEIVVVSLWPGELPSSWIRCRKPATGAVSSLPAGAVPRSPDAGATPGALTLTSWGRFLREDQNLCA
jgi:hypothetical protein